MNGEKKVILHLVFDGILFDIVYHRFEEMEKYENRFLLDAVGDNVQLKYIKNTDKLIIVDSLELWAQEIANPDVDIIYLHGLWQNYLKALDYIRKDVVVMWWCYGMEIYEDCLGWPPLLPLKLYKPRTHMFYLKSKGKKGIIPAEVRYSFPKTYTLIKKTYNMLIGKRDDSLRLFELFLSRIDFAFTPLEMELSELKRKHPFIKAEPFKLFGKSVIKDPLLLHNRTGCLLLEHSANITNNHLDIIAAIKKKKLDLNKRDIFIPLGYGIQALAERVKKDANFEGANVHCLMESLPLEDYKEMICSCTHAIYGMIRQSGLGNIYLCFRKGIKVFFFKDSILYKHFKASGFCIFSIEDDLNDKNLQEPLTPEQAENNYNTFYSIFDCSESYQQQFDNILNNKYNDK